MSGCKEHDVKSMRDTVGETKCQSSINRFFTSPSWNLDDVMKCAQEIIFSTVRHDDNLEFLIIETLVHDLSPADREFKATALLTAS